MRIACITQGNVPSRWAHTIQQMRMAEALVELGHDVHVLTQSHPLHRLMPAFDYQRWYGLDHSVPVVELHSWRASLHRLQRQVLASGFARPAVRWALGSGAELAYTRHPEVLRECVERDLPVLYETHRPECDERFHRAAEVAHDPRVLAWATVTEELARRYVAWGVPEEKLVVLPDGVSAAMIDRDVEPADLAPLGVDANRPVGVYCGHLYESKGIATLLEAARRAPEIQLLVVGGWESDVREWRKRAADLPNVRLPGFVTSAESACYMAAADFVLLPNSARHPEATVTSPLKLFEYMASGRPIVASRLPVFDGVLEDGRNCWTFTPDDPEDLALRLRHAAANPDEGEALVRAAREDVRRFSWDRRAAALLERAKVGGARPVVDDG